MSLPYLPGWYDMIDKDALNRTYQNVGEAFLPNQMAQQKYKQLVQQNPMIMSQLSEMDESQRQAFASALGFNDYSKSGMGNISEGPKLTERKENQAYLNANPLAKDESIAKRVGAQTNTERTRGDTAWNWETQLKSYEIDKAGFDQNERTFITGQRERAWKRLQDAQAANPSINVGAVAMQMTRDPYNIPPAIQQQLTVIQNDPELKDALATIIEADQFNRNNKLRQSELFQMNTGRSESAKLQFYSNIGVRAQTRVKTFEDQILKLQGENPLLSLNPTKAFAKDPQLQVRYESLVNGYKSALEELDTSNKLIGGIVGEKLPTGYSSGSPFDVPKDVLAEQAYAAIKAQPKNEKRIRDAYKARTGKDLP